ncbi:uncharacterized protein LOC119596718 [Penaeus monodon]|uniref:uncharacterized protein LOC119596718 n=1 Tax=Penaeus monodon TaxID=6687 RepID=UPI0018A72515|nr:uncharacterized protein LOC119596718 [Penaeus monodon]
MGALAHMYLKEGRMIIHTDSRSAIDCRQHNTKVILHRMRLGYHCTRCSHVFLDEQNSKLSRDLRDAVIITLYKNKGEKSDCSNYRGITLLSIAGKVFARVLLNRLLPTIAEDHFPETQCGFRTNRGTTDMVFVLGQLQEKCREQNKGLYVTFGRGYG